MAKTLYLVLKYFGVAIVCYVLVQLEVRWHGVGIHHLFYTDEPKLLNISNPTLALTASRFAIVIALLPLGWLNVFVTSKLFKQLPKAIWLMTLITTYHWVLLAIIFWLAGIPGYSTSIIATILASLVGAWITAFHFQNKQRIASGPSR